MIVKVYWTLWALVALSALVLFVAGSLTPMAIIVYGFIAFGLTFMGMMGVLPLTITHPAEPKIQKPVLAAPKVQVPAPAKAYNVLKSA